MISTREKMRMFAELAELVFKINEREDRLAFIDYAGHVDEISVRIYSPGEWTDEGIPEVIYRGSFYLREQWFSGVDKFEIIMEELANV